MRKDRRVLRQVVAPFCIAVLLCFTVVPVTLASTGEQAPRMHTAALSLVGPKQYYLALGDSLAFGYQPDLDYNHGYADDFLGNLQHHGVKAMANMGCVGETSTTFVNGGCLVPFLRKFPYIGSQLTAAVTYLKLLPGQVSPVTLDIGASDFLNDINASNCAINKSQFRTDLATLDANLRGTILPQLQAALTVNGAVTGDIVVMNYYDPYQNVCPKTVSYIQTVNTHLASDVSGYGSIVDVFSAFGGATTPNKNICNYTWMCSIFNNIHATDAGYSVIASAFESGTGS